MECIFSMKYIFFIQGVISTRGSHGNSNLTNNFARRYPRFMTYITETQRESLRTIREKFRNQGKNVTLLKLWLHKNICSKNRLGNETQWL